MTREDLKALAALLKEFITSLPPGPVANRAAHTLTAVYEQLAKQHY
jgi:hypothetical protein